MERRSARPGDDDVVVELAGHDYDADVTALNALGVWPWQQTLRAIRPHRGTLRHVVLLGSSGRGGTHAQRHLAAALLRPYLSPHVRFHEADRAADFDDVRDTMQALHAAVRTLTALRDPATGRRIREHDVLIDVTGGLKPASIAGAMVTLSSGLAFQYVHTSHPDRVLEYDLLHRGGAES